MNLLDMTMLDMVDACDEMGVDVTKYTNLIDDMFWDGHSARDIKEMIQVMEGDCSICIDWWLKMKHA